MIESNTLGAALDCARQRVAKFLVHADEPIAGPRADLFITGLSLADFRTMPHAPLVPVVGHGCPLEISREAASLPLNMAIWEA
jgi:hypothetical protein